MSYLNKTGGKLSVCPPSNPPPYETKRQRPMSYLNRTGGQLSVCPLDNIRPRPGRVISIVLFTFSATSLVQASWCYHCHRP